MDHLPYYQILELAHRLSYPVWKDYRIHFFVKVADVVAYCPWNHSSDYRRSRRRQLFVGIAQAIDYRIACDDFRSHLGPLCVGLLDFQDHVEHHGRFRTDDLYPPLIVVVDHLVENCSYRIFVNHLMIVADQIAIADHLFVHWIDHFVIAYQMIVVDFVHPNYYFVQNYLSNHPIVNHDRVIHLFFRIVFIGIRFLLLIIVIRLLIVVFALLLLIILFLLLLILILLLLLFQDFFNLFESFPETLYDRDQSRERPHNAITHLYIFFHELNVFATSKCVCFCNRSEIDSEFKTS